MSTNYADDEEELKGLIVTLKLLGGTPANSNSLVLVSNWPWLKVVRTANYIRERLRDDSRRRTAQHLRHS